jgi:FtsP/CotA-like multicopper oxidase with cupredoxin domain
MNKHRFVECLALVVVALCLGMGQGLAQWLAGGPPSPGDAWMSTSPGELKRWSDQTRLRRVTPADRKAAAVRRSLQGGLLYPLTVPVPGGTPDYYNYANWAYSPLPTVDSGTGVISGGIERFVDSLPGLGYDNRSTLDQYIPIAVRDTAAYVDCDYYEIGVTDYDQQMHSDLPTTRLRGYIDLAPGADGNAHYLGPMIVAEKGRPVRILFTNQLPRSDQAGSDLFLPVDTSVMGAGMGPSPMMDMYTQNRAVVHLHGGDTPWISDGTVHQWITPANDPTVYPVGLAHQDVPDMPNPGSGSATYYYTNEQSARLMWFHDHSYGITRLNVYAGEAAPYLLWDSVEEDLISVQHVIPDLGGVYHNGIPLIIQDKTFVDAATVLDTDPTWDWGTTPPTPNTGDLWFPHVYMPNQNPADSMGANAFGRWDYGPWFWPPLTTAAGLVHGPLPNPIPGGPDIPGTPNPSIVPESFLDTPLVNGGVYPYLAVERKPYRFRILNACNDRYLNLQLYYADTGGGGSGATATATISGGVITLITVDHGGSGYTSAPGVYIYGGGGSCAAATTTVSGGAVTGVTVTDGGMGFTSVPFVLIGSSSEVKMVPAIPHECDPNWPATWPTDGRAGGVPDPTTAGPEMIQIGSEGGFLPAPVVLPNTPIGYNYNRRDITVLNVENKTLFLGPAERADVIIDFSLVPDGAKIILYNDAPAPVPAFDPRLDYYTGDPDQTDTGGAPTTLPGFGPNTRMIMQFRASGTASAHFDLTALQTAWPTAYVDSQPPPIVPQTTYPPPYQAASDTYSRIESNSLTFTPVGSLTQMTIDFQPKAIQELFELNYGRMNATLGVELPLTNFNTQTTIPLGYIDPLTEIIKASPSFGPPVVGDGTQIWKITHNGVDTHAIHWHLSNVQLINRVGWDGMIKPPDANELGWKETIRMNPLEDVIIAVRPVTPPIPFSVPDSIRPEDVTTAEGDPIVVTDPTTGNRITILNDSINYGWEYMWHCHLLGHEENDMMRTIAFQTVPGAPIIGTAVAGNAKATVNFSPPVGTGGSPILYYTATSSPGGISATGTGSPIVVTGLTNGTTYTFTVTATNAIGTGAPSAPSNAVTPGGTPAAPSNLVATPSTLSSRAPTIGLTWTINSTNEQGFTIQRALNSSFTQSATTFGVGAGVSTFTNTSVVKLTKYYYRVRAYNASGNSAWSNTANATTPGIIPAAPTNLRVTGRTRTSISLAWTDNATNESGFYIQRRNGAGVWAIIVTLPANTTTYTNTGLTPNKSYLYRIAAYNADGTTGYTNAVTGTTLP